MHEVDEDRLKDMMYNLITDFAEGVEEVSDIDELDEAWEAFVDFHSLDENMADFLLEIVVEAAQNDDDELSEEEEETPVQKLLSFLRSLTRMPSPSKPHFHYSLSDKADPYGNVRGNQTSTAKYLGRGVHGTDTPSNSLRTSRQPVMSESIVNPNSSGQGFDSAHKDHPLHAVAVRNGYKYSHSTPVRMQNGKTNVYHTWANKSEHKLGAYEGSNNWNTKVSSSSGHSHSGVGAVQLDAHLKNEAKRYNESYQLPATKLEENILQPLNPRYIQALNKHKGFVFGEGFKGSSTSPAKEWRELEEMKKAAKHPDDNKDELRAIQAKGRNRR